MPLLSRERFTALMAQTAAALVQRPAQARASFPGWPLGWSALSLTKVPPQALAKAENLHLDAEERVAVRDGFVKWGTNLIGEPSVPTSLFQYIKTDGTAIVLATASDGTVWRDAGEAAAWTSIATGLLTGNDVVGRWVTFANLAIHANGGSNVKRYDGTTFFDLAGIPAAVQGASDLIAYQGRLWLMKGSQANFSDLSDPTLWPVNNFLSIDINNGESITGAAIIANQLFIAKPSRWYVVLGNSPTTMGWAHRPGPGPIAISSVIVIDGVAYYLARDGIYRFNGAQPPERISVALDPYIATLNTSRLAFARAGFDPLRREYWLSVSEGAQSAHNATLVLNVDTNSWWKYTFGRNAYATIVGSSKQWQLLGGDTSTSPGVIGSVWKQNSGTTNDGGVITWLLETSLLFPEHVGSVFPSFATLLLQDQAAGTLTLTPLYSSGAATGPGQAVSLDGTGSPHRQIASLGGQGPLMQLRLSGVTSMALSGLEVRAAMTRSLS